MSELKHISDSKCRKEHLMKEIKDKEVSRETKNSAMAELKKVSNAGRAVWL